MFDKVQRINLGLCGTKGERGFFTTKLTKNTKKREEERGMGERIFTTEAQRHTDYPVPGLSLTPQLRFVQVFGRKGQKREEGGIHFGSCDLIFVGQRPFVSREFASGYFRDAWRVMLDRMDG